MFSMQEIFSLVTTFFAVWLVMLPLESLFTARKQPIFRENWLTDLAFFLGQSLLWGSLTVFCLTLFSQGADLVVPAGFREAVAKQPWWLQALEVVLLGDLLIYWGHRMAHRYEILWRFHKIHHTAEHLDWLAAFREHPLDGVYTRLIVNLPAIVFGFSLHTIAGLIVLRGLWGIFIHSNVRLEVGPIKYLLGSPELHHWHHDRDRNAHYNFANLMPLMDLIFGTYYEPHREPEAYGIEESIPQNYFVQMLYPFLPRSTFSKATEPIAPKDDALPPTEHP
ncbi:MAG: sterol desaturase family protein [Myxococcales bacterium]|nr:sterol desaturase family protein [Myxococcales bacterium]